MRIKVALLLVQTFALAAFVMPLNDAHQKGALRFANSVHAAYLLLSKQHRTVAPPEQVYGQSTSTL